MVYKHRQNPRTTFCKFEASYSTSMGVKKRSNKNVQQNGHFYDPMAVTWTEKYSDSIEKVWNTLPNFVGQFLATIAVFTLGASLSGKSVSKLLSSLHTT